MNLIVGIVPFPSQTLKKIYVHVEQFFLLYNFQSNYDAHDNIVIEKVIITFKILFFSFLSRTLRILIKFIYYNLRSKNSDIF